MLWTGEMIRMIFVILVNQIMAACRIEAPCKQTYMYFVYAYIIIIHLSISRCESVLFTDDSSKNKEMKKIHGHQH